MDPSATGDHFHSINTPSYCGSKCNGQHLRSVNNAVTLQVPVQRATPSLNKQRRHITGPSATGNAFALWRTSSYCGSQCNGHFIMEKCICNIYRVANSIRFQSHGKQYITHTDSVRHNNIFIVEDVGRLVYIHACIYIMGIGKGPPTTVDSGPPTSLIRPWLSVNTWRVRYQ